MKFAVPDLPETSKLHNKSPYFRKKIQTISTEGPSLGAKISGQAWHRSCGQVFTVRALLDYSMDENENASKKSILRADSPPAPKGV